LASARQQAHLTEKIATDYEFTPVLTPGGELDPVSAGDAHDPRTGDAEPFTDLRSVATIGSQSGNRGGELLSVAGVSRRGLTCRSGGEVQVGEPFGVRTRIGPHPVSATR
jgi:hypothetical protein